MERIRDVRPQRYMSGFRELSFRIDVEYSRRVRAEGEGAVEAEIERNETAFAKEMTFVRYVAPKYERAKRLLVQNVAS